MGTHPLAPSAVELADDTAVPLSAVAGPLPFMVKILAAGSPLSLQVHPSKELAAAGFAAEEAAGVPLNASHRTYKDPNHKPEMAYALTTFDTLVGLRPTAEILRILSVIDTPLTRRLGAQLTAEPGFAGIVKIIASLLLDGAVSTSEVDEVVVRCKHLADQGLDIKRSFVTAVLIADHHAGDVGVVVALMLNRLTLEPGEAAFLDDGVIHAHLSGMCLEIMATSDNVLRAGLTTKHVNPEALVECLQKGMSRIARVMPGHFGISTEVFSPMVDEFALAVTQCSNADPQGVPLFAKDAAQILVCTGGEVTVTNTSGDSLRMARGDSLFASAEDGQLTIKGTGEVAQTYDPSAHTPQGTLVDLV
ncbi:mannose-6-phosphate isomerase, class I [soil metagenome]